MKEKVVKREFYKELVLEIFAIRDRKQAKVGARVTRRNGEVIHHEDAELLVTWGDAACRALSAVMNGSSNMRPMSHEEAKNAAEMLPRYIKMKFGGA